MVLLAGEQKLMIMRPYQVYAVRHIVQCIDNDHGNGYIWHTTGSGKTLTSFKASTLLKENEHIHKCVFVVDRKDLDRQTREEFNKFQEGCVEENTNTHTIEDGNVLRFHIEYYKVEGASSSQPRVATVAGASSSAPLKSRELEAPATSTLATWEYFNPLTEIDIHQGNLPHWEQGSVWYFITFRLADALPASVVEEIKNERAHWKQTHDLDNLSPEELAEYHRLFSERYENLLNAGSGSCVLRDPAISKIVEDALHYFEGQRYELDEYVIMPNHVHLLVKPMPGHRLVDILHSWKSFTANQINKYLGKTGQLWQHESYDHIVRHERAMEAIRRYIRENPKVAGASSSQPKVVGASSSPTKTPKELEAPATLRKRAVIEAILAKHDAATGGRRFNALLATASINDAIEYYGLFQALQAEKQAAYPDYRPLNIACVFSPPAEGDPDVKQIQEDLPQEKEDNEVEPEKKKEALKAILADYNACYGTNHTIGFFDLYYQDVQKRIKDQQWKCSGSFQLPFSDSGAGSSSHIDITIVVDMLLTGFDSKFLNTLYVDKNLKYHGLIQAFSRTNRVLNATKPYGNILDFRQQQDAVDTAIALFSGGKTGDQARQIWLVDKAPVVIEKLREAVRKLETFMQSQGLDCTPSAVANLKGDAAKAAFITHFKEVQRLKTQLDQYTDLTGEDQAAIAEVLPEEDLRGFKGQYLETAKKLKERSGSFQLPSSSSQGAGSSRYNDPVDQLDFEFVLFASAVIDYDYIMGLLAKFSEKAPGKAKMSREQLIGLISADAKFMNERDDIAEYIGTLTAGEGLGEDAIRAGYLRFKKEKNAKEIAAIAQTHQLTPATLKTFIDGILDRMIFDGEALSDLFAPLDLGWKARTQAELALMADLHPLLTKRAGGREISGLSAYEH